ncbi:ABC transporter permease [Halobium palmae]|uniref:ABC transporter permease n=1 Tax=Halobium palmae TaxID=1776492 RepID=A0ABD5RUR5_9EURY
MASASYTETASESSRGEALRNGFQKVSTVVSLRTVLIAYAILIAAYIYVPIVSLIAFSFNEGGLTFPFVAVTTSWYAELFANEAVVSSIVRSLEVALVVTVITTALGTATALAYRYEFRGRKTILYILLLGIITPGITYGVGATLFFNELIGLDKSLWLAIPVHVVWALPFAVIVLLAGIPPHLARNEQAARVMGASNWTVFREVIFPQIGPTVLGAAVFAFTLSYNEATRSLLVVGQANTMPIQIFSIAASKRATPELFALGSFTTVMSTLLLVGASLLIFYGGRN